MHTLRTGAMVVSLGVAAALAPPSEAAAQETVPVPLAAAFDPDTGEPLAVHARSSGLVVRVDGDDWRLMCAGALDVSGNSNLHIEGLAGGGLVVAHHRGVQKLDAPFCSPESVGADLEGGSVLTVDALVDRRYALATDNMTYDVYVSEDGGLAYKHAFELPADVGFSSLRVAPSDPDRFYFPGLTLQRDSGVITPWLYRTDDGGQSFEAIELLLESGSLSQVAVDPMDADRVYLAVSHGGSGHSHGEDGEPALMDEVLVSEDGGRSWIGLLEVHMFGGLAVGADGTELWVGDGEGGLHRSTDRGASFARVDDQLHVSCLYQRGERLWVCADSSNDPFSLGYTDDGGASFTTVMRFDALAGQLECDGQPLEVCHAPWSGWSFWHGMDAGVPANQVDTSGGRPLDASVPPEAGAVADPSGPGDDGCSCGVTGGSAGSPPVPTAVALALLWWRRRRRATRAAQL